MRSVFARLPVPAGLVVALLLANAAPASAALSVSGVTATPSTTVAGGHPTLTIAVAFGGAGSDQPRTLTIHTGPGLFGNPLAAPTCPVATFEANACPANTIVGSSGLTVATGPSTTATLPGVIYNVATSSPDQASQLGVQTLGPNPSPPPALVPISTSRTPVTISPLDYGLDSANADPFPASPPILAVSFTFNAAAANGFYMSNPTACTPVAVSATATSYGGTTSFKSAAPFTPTDCAHEPFSAGVATHLDTTRTDTPVQVGVTLTRSANDNPRRQADVLSSRVTLPEGMTINPSLADGLAACADAQFALSDRAAAAACPSASRIGTVTFISPLFARTFTGSVYLGAPTPSAANRLFVDVPIPGVHLKLLGRTLLGRDDGRVTTVLENLPQLPFTTFELTFKGGPHSVLTTPPTCGAHTVAADLVPYARLTDPTPPDSTPSTSFTTSFDGAGAACVVRFRPWFRGAPASDRAGARSPYSLTFARPDRDSRLARVAFRLPAGLLGDLALKGLTQCTLATAGKGACPASSKVGRATVRIGSGPSPATLSGSVFLTRPRAHGDPAGLSILVPATLGPVDLGKVVVPVRLQLRADGGLTATSTPLPQFQGGVPISIRTATLTLDRRGFMRNPTSCGHKHYSGRFDAIGGASAHTFAALNVTRCRALRFAPRFAARLGASGATGRSSHPPLTTTIRQRSGEAAIRRAHVALPSGLSTNLRAIDAACTPAALAGGTCSARARIGNATALSPFLSRPLRGPVYLVRTQPGHLPKMVVRLRGPLAIDVQAFVTIGAGNRIATTFPAVPDVPVTRFTLRLHGGPFGILTATRDLCARPLRLPAGFRGQNGTRVRLRPRIAVHGCRR